MRLTLASLFLVACSTTVVTQSAPPGTSDPPVVETVDAGNDADAAIDAGARPPVPALPIVPNQGGPIVPAPEIITLTWQGDPIASELEGFDDWLVSSATWKTMMAEWGVGPGTHLASYRITTPPPGVLDETAVQKVIDDAVTGGHVPPPSASRIYAVYPPSGTRVTSFGAEGCEAFQAYHYGYAHASGQFAIYAITPRCTAAQGMSEVDYVTWGMSHEIMEASSDPQANDPAYVIDAQTDATPELGENADLCAGHPTKIEGHMITRNWSNVAAKAGARPCVPAPAGPNFGAFTDAPSITIAPGETKKIPLHVFAEGPLATWQLLVYPNNAKLTATIGGATSKKVKAGDELVLTVAAAQTFVETEGENLITFESVTSDYDTRRHLIVHQKQ